jgi:3-hydroxybutyryl-CoA dehydrogenase
VLRRRRTAKGIQLGKLTDDDRDRTLQHIRGTTNLTDCASADLVIEAAPEKLELKREILRQLEGASNEPFIFATNTSSLSISAIAEGSGRPDSVIGMHFFNPFHIMRLVEIVVGRQTNSECVEAVIATAGTMRKNDRGKRYAHRSFRVALGLEAMRMVEQEWRPLAI